jgi:hypothetical protein
MNSKINDGETFLFICPTFYGYEELILEQLKNKQPNVKIDYFFYEEKKYIKYTILGKIIFYPLLLLCPCLSYYYWFNKLRHSFFLNTNKLNLSLKKLSAKRYDKILIIKGFGINTKIMQKFRYDTKQKFVLYEWDPLHRFPTVQSIFKYMNTVIFFQKNDLIFFPKGDYLPTFFSTTKTVIQNQNYLYTISFVGNYTYYRERILNKLSRLLKKENNVKLKFILFSKHKHLRILKKRFITNRVIPYYKVSEIYNNSKIILDIQHPKQQGLTQRIYDAINAGRKVITTNPYIIDEPIFNKGNIFYFNPKKINKNDILNFINSSFNFQPEILDYSIEKWTEKLLYKGFNSKN